MPDNSIIHNPVNIQVQIAKAAEGSWKVTPSLTAFPLPRKPSSKNIILLLDHSGSMRTNDRLEKVKVAVSNLLNKLNTIDTFSIVNFNEKPSICVKHQRATPENIRNAQNKFKTISADGDTHFAAAFKAINTEEFVPKASQTVIIFLTDGEDSHGCTADNLMALFPKKHIPRIYPIGVWLNRQNTFLNRLASLSHGKAYYIQDDRQSTYQEVFDEAYKHATLHSQSHVQLEMTIKADTKTDSTKLNMVRTLNHVYFDGVTPVNISLFIDSPTPPYYMKLKFVCDNMSLQAHRKLSPAECLKLNQGQRLDIKMPAFKWQNNTPSTWMWTLGSIAIGILLLSGVAVFVLSAPAFHTWLWQTVAITAVTSLLSSSLFIYGMLALAKKTIFLPTKWAAEIEQTNARQSSVVQQGFFTKNLFAKGLLTASGAALGYAASTTTLATNAMLAYGINPSLFLLSCSTGGAIAMLLFIYGCTRLYNTSFEIHPSPAYAPR